MVAGNLPGMQRQLELAEQRPLHSRIVDVLAMSPLSDHAGTSLAPLERTARELVVLFEQFRNEVSQ